MAKVGVPKEILDNEYRVALTLAGTAALVQDGHTVYVETKAGIGKHQVRSAFKIPKPRCSLNVSCRVVMVAFVDLVRHKGFPLSAKSAAADCFGRSWFALKAPLAASSLAK